MRVTFLNINYLFFLVLISQQIYFYFILVLVSYSITVITGDKRNSGTNANVSYYFKIIEHLFNSLHQFIDYSGETNITVL